MSAEEELVRSKLAIRQLEDLAKRVSANSVAVSVTIGIKSHHYSIPLGLVEEMESLAQILQDIEKRLILLDDRLKRW